MALIVPLALKFARPNFPELDISGAIYDLITDESDTNYIFGSFSLIQGNTRYNMAKLSNTNVLVGTFGTGFPPLFGTTIYGAASAYDFTTSQEIFFVGGSTLDKIKKSDSALVARGSQEFKQGSQAFSGLVSQVLSDSNNTGVFVRGSFNKVGNTSRNRLAKFNQTPTLITTWSSNVGAGYYVYDMALSVSSSSHLYVVGNFPSIKSAARKYIARIRRDTGAVDTTFNANTVVSGLDAIYSVCVLDDDSVVIFGTSGSGAITKFTRINSVGNTVWDSTILHSSFSPGYVPFSGRVWRRGSHIYAYCIAFIQPVSDKIGKLFRFDHSGNLDATFANSGILDIDRAGAFPYIRDLTVNTAGQIIICGIFDRVNSVVGSPTGMTTKVNYAVLDSSGDSIVY